MIRYEVRIDDDDTICVFDDEKSIVCEFYGRAGAFAYTCWIRGVAVIPNISVYTVDGLALVGTVGQLDGEKK